MTDPQTVAASAIPVLVDYTNRDYYALREALIQRVKDRVNNGTGNNWYGNDPSDFGVALVEAFSYMGDVVNYYIDRIANESNILTATQRDSVINLAKSYGYIPSGYIAASCTLTFTNKTEGLATIPAGTQVTGTVTNNEIVQTFTFTTQADVVLSSTASITAISGSGTVITYTAANSFQAGDVVSVTGASTSGFNVTNAVVASATSTQFTVSGSATGSTSTASASAYSASRSVSATHGYNVSTLTGNLAIAPDISGEVIGTSDGTANQYYILSNNQVVDGSVSIFVKSGNNYGQWLQVSNLADYGPNDFVYAVELDSLNNVYVQFGDGVSGAIPNNYATIKAQYVVGGGEAANVPAGTLTKVVTFTSDTDQVKTAKAAVTVTNLSPAVGGSSPENIESIRNKAPNAFYANNRAVTLGDFSGLALQLPSVGKANSTANVWNSVTVYVSPVRSFGANDYYPGKDDTNTTTTTEWTQLQSSVVSAITPKLQIGTSLTVAPPSYVDVSLSVLYSKYGAYTTTQVESDIRAYLANYYDYTSTIFAQILSPQEIETYLRAVPGVINVKVKALYRTSVGSGLSTLVGAASEIFVLKPSSVAVTAWSTDATLASLTMTNGTLSPAFSSGTYNYSFAVTSGQSSTVITAAPTDSASPATLSINGGTSPYTLSGIATNSTTQIPITVTAADGVTIKTYTVTVIRTT
jgi:hypothetical protein